MKKSLGFLLCLVVTIGSLGGYCASERIALESLQVEEARVRVYFTPELNSPIQYDQYKGKTPDPKKHRIVEYSVVVKNTGYRVKHFAIYEPVLDPSFYKLVINSGGSIPVNIPVGRKVRFLKSYFLTEGNPAEVERLAYQSKVRIVWEEGGKKWEKIVNVTPER